MSEIDMYISYVHRVIIYAIGFGVIEINLIFAFWQHKKPAIFDTDILMILIKIIKIISS